MFALVASFASVASAGTAKPVEASLCAIVRDPIIYSGKVVRFNAYVLTDWKHGTLLFFKGCRGGIELASAGAAPSAEMLALNNAIGTPLNGGLNRTVFATFTGRIVWHHASFRPEFLSPLTVDVYRVGRIQILRRMSPP